MFLYIKEGDVRGGDFNTGAVATARERLHRREEVVWKMEPSNKKQRDVPCTSRCYLSRIMGTVLVIQFTIFFIYRLTYHKNRPLDFY